MYAGIHAGKARAHFAGCMRGIGRPVIPGISFRKPIDTLPACVYDGITWTPKGAKEIHMILRYSTKPDPIFRVKVKDSELESAKAFARENYATALEFDFMKDGYPTKGDLREPKSLFKFGIENECATLPRNIGAVAFDRKVEKTCPETYCKYDVSIDSTYGDGLEVITHPCSIGYWFNSKLAERLSATAKDCGFSGDNHSCGLHVHISRSPFEKARMDMHDIECKYVLMFERFWDEFLAVSKRADGALTYAGRTHCTSLDRAERFLRNQHADHDERYYCINAQNAHTIEVRLWAGTSNPSIMKAYISLCNGISQFLLHGGDPLNATFKDVIRYDNQPQVVAELLHNVGIV